MKSWKLFVVLVGMQNVTASLENSMEVPEEIKTELL
jgi:hypothetical protein